MLSMSRRRAQSNALVVNQQQQDNHALSQFAINLGEILSRAALANRMGQSFGGKRDYYDVFGYKKQLEYLDYLAWYRRGGIAKQLIDMPRDTCWRTDPIIQEDEDQYNNTPFETAWTDLCKALPVMSLLKRADTLAGIGRYSVILMGVRQNSPLNTPLNDGALRGIKDIVYLTPYSEFNAPIIQWENDPQSPRFGKPKTYRINIGAPSAFTDGGSVSGVTGIALRNLPVHYTRLVHIAEGTLEDEFYGTPELESVVNLLEDLWKVCGGSAEVYWLNARNGLKIRLDEGNALDPDSMEGKLLKENIDAFSNQLKRYLYLQGADASTLLNNQPIDPTGAYQAVTEQIAATKSIPKRLLVGSERGELASTQDRITWAERMMGRRRQFLTHGVVLPLVNRLLALGALPKSKAGPFVKWEPLLELDEKERAAVAMNRAQALQEYLAHPEAKFLVPPGEFRRWLGEDAEISPDMLKTIDELLSRIPPPPPSPPAPTPIVVQPKANENPLMRRLRLMK